MPSTTTDQRSTFSGSLRASLPPRKPPSRVAGASSATASQSTGAPRLKITTVTEAITSDSRPFNALSRTRVSWAHSESVEMRITPRAPPK